MKAIKYWVGVLFRLPKILFYWIPLLVLTALVVAICWDQIKEPEEI